MSKKAEGGATLAICFVCHITHAYTLDPLTHHKIKRWDYGGIISKNDHKQKKRDSTGQAETLSIAGARDENRTRTGTSPEGF